MNRTLEELGMELDKAYFKLIQYTPAGHQARSKWNNYQTAKKAFDWAVARRNKLTNNEGVES
jgi:hypothetical protein